MQKVKKINIALIGYGYWGKNFARIIDQSPDCNLYCIIDNDSQKRTTIESLFNKTLFETHIESIINNKDIDAAIVATPVTSHYNIVNALLDAGKHVLCEKVLSTSVSEIEYLKNKAKQHQLVLMVGHTFVYNAIVKYIKKAIENGDCGDILYLTFKRTGLGPIRQDVDVIYDLAAHDISILIYLMGMPIRATNTTRCMLQQDKADIAFIHAVYGNQVLADIQVSWLSPIKQRIIEIVGTKQMMIFDDVNVSEKLRIIKTGKDYHSFVQDFGSFQLSIKDGDIIIPSIPYPEPLAEEVADFVFCIQHNQKPIADADLALNVATVIDALQVKQ